MGLKKQCTSIRDWQITISSPERAILELLYQVGDKGVTFLLLAETFESLTTLSPRLLVELLQNCNNRKVKRLFLFFVNYYNFPWAKHISKELGAGKLQIVKDGNYNKTCRAKTTVEKGVVEKTARKFGFYHMGQFAKSYKAFFGELASEMLKVQSI